MTDVVAVLSGAAKAELVHSFKKAEDGFVKPFEEIGFTYYIRANCGMSEIREKLENWCDDVSVLSDNGGKVEAIAGVMTKTELDRALDGIDVESVIRVRT